MLVSLTVDEHVTASIVMDLYWRHLEDIEAVACGYLTAWDIESVLGGGTPGSGSREYEIPQENRLIGRMLRRDMFNALMERLIRDRYVSLSELTLWQVYCMGRQGANGFMPTEVPKAVLEVSEVFAAVIRSGAFRGYYDLDELSAEHSALTETGGASRAAGPHVGTDG